MVAVTVIVVNFNSGPHLARCLAALSRQTFADFEAVVIDNASTDGMFAEARDAVRDPRFTFIANAHNSGFAAANNQGAACARGAWLALLNPDAFPAPDWLERLVDATTRHPAVAMFGSTQIDAADAGRLDGAGDAYLFCGLPWRGGYGRPLAELPREDYGAFGPCAAAALYSAALFRELGGFDESLFAYCEDVDLAFRARLRGEEALQVVAATVRHVGGGSATPGAARRALGLRNLAAVFVKNMPGPLLVLLAPAHALALLALSIDAARRGDAVTTLRALAQGLRMGWRMRSGRSPNGASGAVARSICWSPAAFLRRQIVRLPANVADSARARTRSK